MAYKAYKFRLHPNAMRPNAKQERELEIMLESHRHLYNDALAQREWFWQEWQISRTYQDWFKDQRAKNPYYARLNFSSAQGTLRRLDKAFANFFRRVRAGEEPGYPCYKSRDRFSSILFPSHGDGIRFNGTRLYVQHVGTIRVCLHRHVEGAVKTISLKCEGDKWFVVATCEVPEPINVGNALPAIGLDVGLTHFVTTSAGETIEKPQFLKDALPELRRAERSLSRKKEGRKESPESPAPGSMVARPRGQFAHLSVHRSIHRPAR